MGRREKQSEPRTSAGEQHDEDGGVLKAIREEVQVGRERIETGKVRVAVQSEQREEVIDEPVWQQVVEIEHVPINRVIEGPIPVRTEGDTTIIPVLEEQLVLERRLVLKEEVRITRRSEQERIRQTVPLLDEQIVIERVPIRDALPPTQQPMKGESSHGKNSDRIVPEPHQRRRNDR